MQHLDEGEIHAWLDGALSTDEGARMESHASTCGECAAMVANARGLIAGATRIASALDVVRGNVIPATAPSSHPASQSGSRQLSTNSSLWSRLHLTPARAALAATLLVAVSSMMVVRHGQGDSRVLTNRMQVTPAEQTPAVAPAPPSAVTAGGASAVERDVAKARESKDVAAPPQAPREAPRQVSAESLEAHDVNPATAAPRRLEFSGKARPLQDVVTTSTGAAMAAGAPAVSAGELARCYAVVGDSGTSAMPGLPALAALPTRFFLETAADGSRNVRLVTDDGRVGATLPSARWEQLSSTSARVVFPASPASPASAEISVALTAGNPIARASSAGVEHAINVRPIDCRK